VSYSSWESNHDSSFNPQPSQYTAFIVHIGRIENTHTALLSKTEGKRTLVRYRHRWEDNNKMNQTKIVGSGQGPMIGCCDDVSGSGLDEKMRNS
jgi:hypothetical protein